LDAPPTIIALLLEQMCGIFAKTTRFCSCALCEVDKKVRSEMQDSRYSTQTAIGGRFSDLATQMPKKAIVGFILIVALIAFEIFNFDTTQYALRNLLGDVRFLGMQWAAILAIAFCAIDFAGLVRLFTPERGLDEPKEVWYLMGAWLLGATMNAVMTWWAISLTLLNHNFGNEVLSREQLLLYVPIFVAVLVWLTRILFIGAFTVAGEHIFDFAGVEEATPVVRKQASPSSGGSARGGGRPRTAPRRTRTSRPAPMRAAPTPAQRTVVAAPKPQPRTLQAQPAYQSGEERPSAPYIERDDYSPGEPPSPPRRRESRVNRRPPRPAFGASSREKH
jgi:hypothetical protein